jgi:hypothetical protein
MKTFISSILIVLIAAGCAKPKDENLINLAGEWSFKTDPRNKGIIEKWYNNRFPETILLPGSMAENGKGNDITVNTQWTGEIVDSSWFKSPDMAAYRQPGHIKVPFWLQPEKYYVGTAWYQQKVIIPPSWKNKNIQLYLERCHWETHVWIDGHDAGMQNSLGTPHVYNLTSLLKPGTHLLTICVDNRIKDIDVGKNSHSVSDHTQGNWNGMTGRLELQARNAVYISDARVYPDLTKKHVTIKLYIQNGNHISRKTNISIRAVPEAPDLKPEILTWVGDRDVRAGLNEFEIVCPMGDHPLLWDEFEPSLYRLKIEITDDKQGKDTREITFGMREFGKRGTQFTINGRPVFLRGTLECAIFPKTGYPPTDTASWMRIFRIARAHGLNHMRFHSWCPPEAAFEAADHAGFYLHVECSSWANSGSTLGDGKPIDSYLYAESERMVRAYGNHPSFCMMLYGNEPAGANLEKWLAAFVTYWKAKDPRRLYSSGAGWPLLPETDFNSTAYPRIQGLGEGLTSIINAQPPRSDYDWADRIAGTTKPTVSHEIGQWCVYPDFKEIKQYTGVLKAKNFEIFQESLHRHHMENLADSFLLASGKLQALCYKADIEAALRTPGFGGFQLLDLHDFPGQGTALVGVLNPFWNAKGYITSAEYSEFCNSTVPLARLSRMIYKSDETLQVPVEIAHFGPREMTDVTPSWKITDSGGRVVFSGKLQKQTITFGNGIKLGEIRQPLKAIQDPEKLILTVEVGKFKNHWDIWVFPANLPETGADVLVTRTLDQHAMEVLKNGGKVLLTPVKGKLRAEYGGDIAVGFSSIFWNTAWTGRQAPHTLGILCNPSHPALASFPSDYYSNWQWWDAMSHANAIILSGLQADLKPIVRIIDDWFTNRPLALIFEANTGKGKIIVCGADLLTDLNKRPEAQQLLYSLKKYMAGDRFNPETFVDAGRLQKMFQQ